MDDMCISVPTHTCSMWRVQNLPSRPRWPESVGKDTFINIEIVDKIHGNQNKLEPKGALIAQLSTMNTSVIS